MPGGRPTDYTEALADELCSRIALGNSLKRITEMDDMPSASAVYNWLGRYPEFVDKYAKAKADSADSRADQVEEIAEKVLTGEYEPQQARVAIDAFKWTSGKHKPKKYGDRQHVDHTSSDGTMSPNKLSDEELNARIRALVEKRES